MRVAHFLLGRCNPDGANGVDKTVYYLSKTQAALDDDVAVLSLTDKTPIPIQGVSVTAYCPSRWVVRLPRPLLTQLLDWRPDIVHLHSTYTPQNAVLACWLRGHGVAYVVSPLGGLSPYVMKRRLFVKALYRRLVELALLNGAEFVHAVSEEEADDIRRYGVRVPVVVAPNGIDGSGIPEDRDKGRLASQFPEVRGKQVFLFLGRLDPVYKGLDLLLEAFALARLSDVVLVLVGPDSRGSRQTLGSLADRLGIAAQVVFVGPVYGREKFDLLEGADVFVHPSRSEGMPMAVLEAAACGKVCLVTKRADPGGKLSRYQAGVIVEPEITSIAVGLRACAELADSEMRSMQERALAMVEAEFTWEQSVRTLGEAYAARTGKSGT